MSQLEWAQNLTQELREFMEMAGGPLAELEEVLARAQNQPPQGMSDSSISAEHYNKLRSLLSAFAGVKLSLRVLPR